MRKSSIVKRDADSHICFVIDEWEWKRLMAIEDDCLSNAMLLFGLLSCSQQMTMNVKAVLLILPTVFKALSDLILPWGTCATPD